MLKGTALIPFLFVLVFLFSNASGQQISISKDEFYKGADMVLFSSDGKSVVKKYEVMSAAERNSLPQPTSPSLDLINSWKNYVQYPVIDDSRIPEPTDAPVQCRIFIDQENVESKSLDNRDPTEFVAYNAGKFDKNGFTLISVNLYTKKYIESQPVDNKFVMVRDNQAAVGPPDPPFMIPAKYRSN
jgi:hypothetical protein